MNEDEPEETLEFDWPGDIGNEEMSKLVAWAQSRGIPLDKCRRARSRAGSERFAAPPVFSYEDGEGRLVFMHDLGLEGLLDLPDGAVADTVIAPPELPLRWARQLYGPDLAGFGRTYWVTSPSAAGEATAKRIDYSVQLFVRKTGKAS